MNAEMNWSDDSSNLPEAPLERARLLEKMLITVSRGGELDDSVYNKLRLLFMKKEETKSLLPDFVGTYRDRDQLWSHFKEIAEGSGSYKIRREHINDAFRPLLDCLEGVSAAPADAVISGALASLDAEGVNQAWARALERREEDPEGAITAARTLLETVCMHILDEAGQIYGKDDLPKLYQKIAKVLNLAPSEHTQEVFKVILGNCQSVVQSLGTLRNRIGDAHGKGRKLVKPAPRHAALAVNLAGSMATFLVETWLNQQNGRD